MCMEKIVPALLKRINTNFIADRLLNNASSLMSIVHSRKLKNGVTSVACCFRRVPFPTIFKNW